MKTFWVNQEVFEVSNLFSKENNVNSADLLQASTHACKSRKCSSMLQKYTKHMTKRNNHYLGNWFSHDRFSIFFRAPITYNRVLLLSRPEQ